MVVAEGVNKRYGDYHAPADVTETVHHDDVVVVCGPPGLGRFTSSRTLNRPGPTQSGSIRINGHDVYGRHIGINQFRSHISFVFQQFNLFPRRTNPHCKTASSRP